LHLSLQLDLGLVLLVGVGAHDVLELFGVLFLVLLALVEVLLLKDTVLGEEVFNLLGVTFKNLASLVVEFAFDELELGGVVLTHLLVLEFHVLDELLDVVSHGLHGLDVVLVLVVETALEFINQDLLLRDDLCAGGFLGFNFLIELLAVFLLFKFLPVPIDFDILLMGGDNFILDFVCSFFLGLILQSSAGSFSLIGLSFNRVDRALSLSKELLEITSRLIDLDVTLLGDFDSVRD